MRGKGMGQMRFLVFVLGAFVAACSGQRNDDISRELSTARDAATRDTSSVDAELEVFVEDADGIGDNEQGRDSTAPTREIDAGSEPAMREDAALARPEAGSRELLEAASDGGTCDVASPACVCALNLQSTHWDVALDFSGALNPCGVWSYGYTRTLGSAFILFTAPGLVGQAQPTASCGSASGAMVEAWSAEGGSNLWRNSLDETCYSVSPGEFSLHPGRNGEWTTARWTAPRAGRYQFEADFKVGDAVQSTSKTAALLLDGAPINQSLTASNPSYTTTRLLSAGQTFDVAVGLTGDQTWISGNTPTSLKISLLESTESPNAPVDAKANVTFDTFVATRQ
jgi:hypothetical protein